MISAWLLQKLTNLGCSGSRFTKQRGGVIYGSDASSTLQNTPGTAGHAVYIDSSSAKVHNTTAGSGVSLDSGISGSAGGWE